MRAPAGLLSLSLSLLLFVPLLPSAGAAQSGNTGTATLSGRVLGRIFGWPANMAPPAGVLQELALLQLADGSMAVVIYRYSNVADRLPQSFWDASKPQSLAAAPVAGCSAHLRDLVVQQTTDPKTGAAFTRMSLVRLPGVQPEIISNGLDQAPACYLALASAGGAQ